MKKFSVNQHMEKPEFITVRPCIACGNTMKGHRCSACGFTLMYGYIRDHVVYGGQSGIESLKEISEGCLLIIRESQEIT